MKYQFTDLGLLKKDFSELLVSKRARYNSKLTRAAANHRLNKDKENDDAIDEDESNLDKEQVNALHSFFRSVFGMIIGDEAQKLKSTLSMTHKSVHDMQADYHLLLTATPMINRPLDLRGLLSLF